ncbi:MULTISPECIES: DUF4282 domain-containing protein [Metabacillus]|uniref:DUF4282 domain-containing protein n=1 Tax=Metabacillus hrfriensis TaxID=3048891 RepID=A0ACD4RAN3_9BACI|nr:MULTISPECIES: DUF4282 domain-containing protein [Metabacillus]UAL51992.1 DUF4282 domain-containing protein [Metabacillus dongyingensis]UOK57783.1 DUF4282 domain-containing protein [Bacillus sp. OVS6]USK28307.1 DUF4282 domain-containing protein [Bacillus sp. CMF21]WHZ57504.1 DUF4282 domain-containing protein [Metabacillus sp. CT-WN-B3]
MQDFLKFNKMITPTIISVIFYVGSAISVIAGFVSIISGANAIYGGGAQIFAGLFMILLGPFVIRIYCELLIVIFKMNEALQDITKNVSLKGKSSVSSSETL